MPAASWPRCCSACRPRAVMAGCFRVPKNTEDSAFLSESIVAHLRITELGELIVPMSVRHGCLPLKHPPQHQLDGRFKPVDR